MLIAKIAAINIALYTFITLNPYIKWLVPNEYFYAFFLLSTLITTYLLNNRVRNGLKFDFQKKRIAFALIIFIVYFTSPLVHELRWGHLLWEIPFFMILFYDDSIIQNGYRYLKKIMVWVAIFALVFWVLNILKIPIPYYSYYPDFRYFSDDYYRIYGPTISLYSGALPAGGVYGIERITGVFAEPGHFGIYLGLILAIDKFNFSARDNKILLITGILTFSTAFFGILLLGLAYKFYMEKRLIKGLARTIIIISAIVSIGFLFGGEGFNQLLFGRVLYNENTQINSITDVVESRISERYIEDFQEFSQTSDLFFGLGYYVQESIPTTNWRGVIYRFGVIGLFIILILLLAIVNRANFTYALLLFSIAILILSHRSYFLYTPAVYVLFFIASTLYKKDRLMYVSR